MGTPATSGYPGTPALLFIMGLCATIFFKSMSRLRKIQHGIVTEQYPFSTLLAIIVSALLFTTSLLAIVKHYFN